MSPVTNLIYQALREEPPLTGFRRSSPLRGASILPYDCGGSPGGELDAKRPEGWFLAANLRQHRTIPALRLKHRSGGCGTASALPKCSIRHPVLSALLAWHLPHLARRIGT